MFFHQQDMIGVNEYDIYGQGLSTVYSGVGSPKHSASGTLEIQTNCLHVCSKLCIALAH